jgi:hypothetical protein
MILRLLLVLGFIFVPYIVGRIISYREKNMSWIQDSPMGYWSMGILGLAVVSIVLMILLMIGQFITYGHVVPLK